MDEVKVSFNFRNCYESIIDKIASKINIKPEKIISYESRPKEIWDLFIILLAMQTSFFVPLELSFPGFKTTLFDKAGFLIWDNMMDLFFLIDIILTFKTSYVDHKGVEIFNSNLIAKKYMMSYHFYFDLASIFGSNIFGF